MAKISETDQKTVNPQGGDDAPKGERPATPQLGAIRRFGEIDLVYMSAREQAWVAARRRFEAAHRRSAAALATLQEDVQTKLAQAYQQGVDAWEDASTSEDSGNRYQELNRQYMATTGTICEDARARLDESLLAFNKEAEDVGNELNDATKSAYRDYLRSLQGAWRALDVDAVVDACAVAAALRLK